MNLDQVSVLLGEFGTYQKQKYFLMCLFSTLSAFHALNMIFVGAEQSYRCRFPAFNFSVMPLENVTFQEKLDLLIPAGEKCHHYEVIERQSQLEKVGYNVTAVLMTSENVSQVTCTAGYEYSKEEYVTTITSDVGFFLFIYHSYFVNC